VLALAVVALGGAAVWWILRPAPRIGYVYDSAEVATLRVIVTATGSLQPMDKVTVGAEVSGRVDEILVDFNDPVRKGQVLARLNTDELTARAVQARAGVVQAEANLAKAEHDHARIADLREREYVSQEIYDQALATRDFARAALTSAGAAADQAEASLAKAVVRSPIDGVVLDRKVDRGQTVAATFQTPELFVIASDLARLELTVDIDEADVGEVRVGQNATFSVYSYPARTFTAKVKELRNAARTIANVVTYQGVLDADNTEGLLRPGMTATADIVVRVAEEVVSVPNRTLRFAPPADPRGSAAAGEALADASAPALGRGTLWSQTSEGTLVARAVTVGITDGQRTEITSGNVRPGERFIGDLAQPDAAPIAVSPVGR
jgi:HlyD family secretion protein